MKKSWYRFWEVLTRYCNLFIFLGLTWFAPGVLGLSLPHHRLVHHSWRPWTRPRRSSRGNTGLELHAAAVFMIIWCYFQDYDFDLESGLMKGARHITPVVCMVIAPHIVSSGEMEPLWFCLHLCTCNNFAFRQFFALRRWCGWFLPVWPGPGGGFSVLNPDYVVWYLAVSPPRV